MSESIDYKKIMEDEQLFRGTVYTPLSKAIEILGKRQKDPELIKKVEEILNKDIPEPFKKMGKYGVSEKQVATPNWDTRRFISLTREFQLQTVFSEYYDDKFTSNNEFKHSLGQIHIQKGVHKDGSEKLEKITIVDFNKNDGKKLKDVQTIWGEPLISFHKRLFEAYGYDTKEFIFHDASAWLKRKGSEAKKYYMEDLLVYVCHGILFENFLLKGKEKKFTKDIFLPAFQAVIEATGVKPLIVPVEPIDMEEDPRCVSYDEVVKKYIVVDNFINNIEKI